MVKVWSVPTRDVLLRLGRSTVDSTVTASGLTEPGLAGDARARFDRMAEEVVWPDQLANQIYLVEMVLPVAAFYQALRERGLEKSQAISTVQHAFLATGDAQRRTFVLLLRTHLGARLALRTLRPNWLGLTPPPHNRWTVTRPTPDTVQVEVTRCYRLDAFHQIGTPEVAFIACTFEASVMDVSPHIRFAFTTMATGADCCRHQFELLRRPGERPRQVDS